MNGKNYWRNFIKVYIVKNGKILGLLREVPQVIKFMRKERKKK